MRRKIASLLVFVASLAGIAALAQQDFSKVEIKATHVGGKVYMLEGSGGNIGLSVGKDGVLMIDDQYAPLAEKIQTAIEKLGGGKPRFILNTHWHGDHTGGNAFFGRDGTIIAHANVRERLATKQRLFGREIEPQPPEALPMITYRDSVNIHFNGEEIRIVHLPNGHTDGDSVVFFTGSNVVHIGDLMFNGMFPFVDLDSGGDVEGYLRNIENVLARLKADTKVIPGHGPLATVDDLRTVRRMFVECIAAVRSGIAAGKSVEELKAAGLPEEWEPWGVGFIKTDRWIETLHTSLTR